MRFIIFILIGFYETFPINASDKLDSSLSSHCFKRVSIGERLITYDVTRIVERNTINGCEEECNIYKCTFFSFGIAPLGNGTCELTTDREISRRQDTDFDLYQRTEECVEGKPKGYEETCYRRIISGKRLHERFIRHSLPCNSLEACQHQCSIEKHFDCQGFNIRLDPARVGRGVCELSSFEISFLDFNRDFVFDPEFTYYEKDKDNESPNCGHINTIHSGFNSNGYHTPISGGPYYGGDSYGPWSTGHGTVDHGPWGSHGYGSGFYQSNNPSRGPAPVYRPNTPFPIDPYGYAEGRPYSGFQPGGLIYPNTFKPQYPINPGASVPQSPGTSTYPVNGPYGNGGHNIYYPGGHPITTPASHLPGGVSSTYPHSGVTPGSIIPRPQYPGGQYPGESLFPASGTSNSQHLGVPQKDGGLYPGSFTDSRYPIYPYPAGSTGKYPEGDSHGPKYPAGILPHEQRPGIFPGQQPSGSLPAAQYPERAPGEQNQGGLSNSKYPGSVLSGGNAHGGSSTSGQQPGSISPGSQYPGVSTSAGQFPRNDSPGGHYPGSNPSNSHYPGGGLLSGRFSGGVSPGGRYPGGIYSNEQYPIVSPDIQYTGSLSPGGIYPGGQYSKGQYPGANPMNDRYPGGPLSNPQRPEVDRRNPGGHYPEGPLPDRRLPGGHFSGGVPPDGRYSGGDLYKYRYPGTKYPGGFANFQNPGGTVPRFQQPGQSTETSLIPYNPGSQSFGGGPAGAPYAGSGSRPQNQGRTYFSSNYPVSDRRHGRPNRIPTYIIIDANANKGYDGSQKNFQSYTPNTGYLPQPDPIRPPLPPPPQIPSSPYFPSSGVSFGVAQNTIGHEVCFRREHPGYKLNPSSIKGMYETPTVLECEAMCNKSPFKCTGYSFRYSSSNSGPNCLLTDFTSLNRETHLLPDRSCDVYLKMETCVDNDRISDTECFIKIASNRKLDVSKISEKVTVNGMSECELACLSSKLFTCRTFSYRHGLSIIGESFENCLLSDWPTAALLHQDFVPQESSEIYERGSYGHGCELDLGLPFAGTRPPYYTHHVPFHVPPFSKGSWNVEETWQHFTVSGWPCRAGTECQLNSDAGFWSCEVEGGDRAQWDYCCKPKHSCGFSRGFNYPWCYVGEASSDQWRPCSEFYYPEFDNRYPYRPVNNNNPEPDSYGPPSKKRPWTFGPDLYGPPSYWPISYIYWEPPPNETSVWDPEVLSHPTHHHLTENCNECQDNSPKIRFKPYGHKSYPRAIIQKLDLKDFPKAENPGEQMRLEEKPRHSKKVDPNIEVFGISSDDKETESAKEQIKFKNTKENTHNVTEEFSSTKRELHKNGKKNDTEYPLNKTKEVIKTIEKFIEENSTKNIEMENNETLTNAETKYPGFVTLRDLEKVNFGTIIWN